MTGRPIYTQLRCLPGFTIKAIKAYAQANIMAGSRVLSDGLGCSGEDRGRLGGSELLSTQAGPRGAPTDAYFARLSGWAVRVQAQEAGAVLVPRLWYR